MNGLNGVWDMETIEKVEGTHIIFISSAFDLPAPSMYLPGNNLEMKESGQVVIKQHTSHLPPWSARNVTENTAENKTVFCWLIILNFDIAKLAL